MLHRIVISSFNGFDKERIEANHIDGDKSNCRLDNLEWCTPKENVAHAHKIGLASPRIGESHGRSKICEHDVLSIRSRYGSGEKNQYELAEEYGLNQAQIWRIVHRKTWKHVA